MSMEFHLVNKVFTHLPEQILLLYNPPSITHLRKDSVSQINALMKSHFGSHLLNVIIGVIGMLLVIYGTLLPVGTPQKAYYLIGAGLMLVSAILERQQFFIILELIIVAGTAIAFAHISNLYKEALPLALSFAALTYLGFRGELKDKLTLFGGMGIIVLALGFAITNPLVYLVGGALLTVYSYFSWKRGVRIAIIWAVLNAVFVLTSVSDVYRLITG